MRFLGRSLLGLFLLAATIGLLLLAGITVQSAFKTRADRDSAKPVARERIVTADVSTIAPETLAPVLSVHGELSSRRALDVRSLTGGTVVEMADGFETGSVVQEGSLLLRIDPTNFQRTLELAETDLSQAEAELRDASAALDLARDDLSNAQRQADLREAALVRQQDLVKRRVGTEAAVETASLAAASAQQAVLAKRQAVINAQARVATAEASLTRRKIQLDEAQRRLEETEIYAEIGGTLAEVSAIRGGVVTANEKLARIIDPSLLEVSFRLSTAQYARLLDGQGALMNAPVTVRLQATGVNLVALGRITRENADVGTGQTGRLVFATLSAAPGLRPGDFVTVEIVEPPLLQVVRIPSSALDAQGTILVLGEDDRLEAAAVELLRRQGDDAIVRATGLAGREYVLSRNPALGAGIRIRPIREGAVAVEPEPKMVTLDAARVALLKDFVQGSTRMPQAARDRILKQLDKGQLPEETLRRLESRMGQ